MAVLTPLSHCWDWQPQVAEQFLDLAAIILRRIECMVHIYLFLPIKHRPVWNYIAVNYTVLKRCKLFGSVDSCFMFELFYIKKWVFTVHAVSLTAVSRLSAFTSRDLAAVLVIQQ